ncbi:MAG: plasmid stabilization protein [Sphingomonadaceae bacterium]|nr:plasmid stabilization protein [Sphingomonadaceae bacterium]
MGSVTIRNIDDAIKQSARLAAARNGRSLEAELRLLLETTYAPAKGNRVKAIREAEGENWVQELIGIADGADLSLPPRTSKRGDPFNAG